MCLTAAASRFVVFLLSVSVTRCQNSWKVSYTPTEICALVGSTVKISSTYSYPSRVDGHDITVERALWFTRFGVEGPVDLRTRSEYAGRVEHQCERNSCTLTITDLRKSDSAEYKFRLETNQPAGEFTGSPGVTLTVSALQVQVTKKQMCLTYSCQYADLECRSSCRLPDQPSYIWYKNGEETSSPSGYYYSEDSVSCAIKGRKDVATPSVCVYDQYCNKVTYTSRSICAFKGSSVDISCSYKSHSSITSKQWFSPQRGQQWSSSSQPDSQRRVQVFDTWRGWSTLRISDLTESDSAEYRFRFTAGSLNWGSSLPGTTLTVTDPDLRVLVIGSSTGPTLVCHSSCLTDRSAFIWYKNRTRLTLDTSPSYRGSFDDGYHYSCAYNHHHSLPVYAPVVPSVLVSPPGDIMKDSSVSLNCSSDANPAAKYTWYKNSQALVHEEPQLVFSSIQSSDSGEYYCTVENDLGKRTSRYVSVNVKYGPQHSSVSVSLSEIVEGSSVTLTCNSDANPAASYTWYKENQTLFQGAGGIYLFKSIRPEDTGNYHCKSENPYRQINSSSFYIDVQYAPKLPSVSVSPSAEVMEGNSVTLNCSSDANPAANYTWYKENKDSPKASGQNFNITNLRAEDSGNYYCEAQNRRGNRISQLYLTVRAGAWKSAVIGTVSAVLLLMILLVVFLWISKKHFTQQSNGGEKPNNRAQLNMSAVDETTSAAQPADQQDDLHYANIHTSLNHSYALYANCGPGQPRSQAEEEGEEDGVEYSVITTRNASSAPRSAAPPTEQRQEDEDPLATYSTVNKIK